jgi:hypothetical protein
MRPRAAAALFAAFALALPWAQWCGRPRVEVPGVLAGLERTRAGPAWRTASDGPREPAHTPPVPVPAPGSPGSAAVGIARGTLAQASAEQLTLTVPGHAPIELDVGAGAAVRLDGRPISASQIPPGADVEARYRVEGDRAVATRIDARRPTSWPSRETAM